MLTRIERPRGWSRRRILTATLGLSAAALGTSALGPVDTWAACLQTPRQGEGPFYPPQFGRPGNDLLIRTADGQGPKGQPIALVGKVTDAQCRPVPGAVVEIWQADADGHYAHPRDIEASRRDPLFRYFGHAVTDAHGGYRFRTLLPSPYKSWLSWRAPHIHFKVHPPAGSTLTTQMYFAGHELNRKDSLVTALSAQEQEALMVAPLEARSASDSDDALNALTHYRFNIALT